MSKWNTIAYYHVCLSIKSIFHHSMDWVLMCCYCCFSSLFFSSSLHFNSLLLHQGWKSNWGENLACCASEYSIDIVYAKAVSLHHPHPYPFPLASNCPHIFIRSRMQTHIRGVRSTKCEIQNIRDGIDRRMCTLHWCASLSKSIMNLKCTQHLPYTHRYTDYVSTAPLYRCYPFLGREKESKPFLFLDLFVFLHTISSTW